MKPVYIIGHKNPDIDAVASAIGYQAFKQSQGPGLYQAAVAGELDDEALFVLDYLGFIRPPLIKSVSTTVEDLLDEQPFTYVNPETSLLELSQIIRRKNIKTLPVLDTRQKFLGLLTIGDLAMIFMEHLIEGSNQDRYPGLLQDLLKRPVSEFMRQSGLLTFEPGDSLDEARKQMLNSRFRNYPVIDEQNLYRGMISRYHLLQMKRKRLILVDHNEKSQAVDGIEEAEIIEIIDHHRVGGLQTISPIYFHNEPVGSTSTLVAERFIEMEVSLSRELAGLLLSGILSDTLIFRSPTTSDKDRRIAVALQELSGLDPLQWGKKIFEQALKIGHKKDENLINSDMKEYSSEDLVFAVAQLETIDLSALMERKGGMLQAMEDLCQRQNYSFMCLMLTDILEEASEILIAGQGRSLLEQAFNIPSGQTSAYVKGLLSRKKQLVPAIFDVLRRQNL